MNYKKVYNKVFKDFKNYNSNTSLSYHVAKIALDQKKLECKSISDIGSGKGNLINEILKDKNYINLKINSYDLDCFLEASLKQKVNFNKIDLSNNKSLQNLEYSDFLFCLDVLEHIEKKYIDLILGHFAKKSKYSFFTIANHSDVFGGVELHLIQENKEYWTNKIRDKFNIISSESYYNDRLYSFFLKSKI
jgi:2-polyprenyl-3-methyl-5-hydroxy-6-metoxy-1,4-benzoquinol methylase